MSPRRCLTSAPRNDDGAHRPKPIRATIEARRSRRYSRKTPARVFLPRRSTAMRPASRRPRRAAHRRPSTLTLFSVDAALRDRPARLAEARGEPGVDERLGDRRRRRRSWCSAARAARSRASPRRARRARPATEERLGRRDHRIRRLRSVHEARHLEREPALRLAPERLVRHARFEPLDLGAREEREDLEPVDDVGVVGVEPELVDRVRAA